NIDARLILPYSRPQVSSNPVRVTKTASREPHAVPLLPQLITGEASMPFRDRYTKLRIRSLGKEPGIDSAVYFDTDALVLRNSKELFAIPLEFGATPDI
ncbi:hypothetical protein K435DRAFT_900510, partial [Dendrothele bispora CBS 962.96]